MEGRLVFLLEEPSMKELLEELLPRLFPGWCSGTHFLCVTHEGKTDLDRSIPRKLTAWRTPGDRFVIVRDNDTASCLDLKKKLMRSCSQSGRPDTLVRLVCQELESWYIGDLEAVATAYEEPKIDTPANRKRYAVPDDWAKPSVEIKRLVPAFQKRSGARLMGQHLEPDSNRSHSYRIFLQGILRMATEMGYRPPADM